MDPKIMSSMASKFWLFMRNSNEVMSCEEGIEKFFDMDVPDIESKNTDSMGTNNNTVKTLSPYLSLKEELYLYELGQYEDIVTLGGRLRYLPCTLGIKYPSYMDVFLVVGVINCEIEHSRQAIYNALSQMAIIDQLSNIEMKRTKLLLATERLFHDEQYVQYRKIINYMFYKTLTR